MNNRTGILTGADNINLPRLAFITAVMAAGAAAGSIYTSRYLIGDFFTFSQLCGTQLFRQLAVFNIIPIFAIFLSSYFGYGAFVALCAVFCKGFVLAAPLTGNIMAQGIHGYFSFAGIGSVCALVSAFAAIIMSMQAIEMSRARRGGRVAEEDSKSTFLLLLCCAAGIILGGAIDAYMMK